MRTRGAAASKWRSEKNGEFDPHAGAEPLAWDAEMWKCGEGRMIQGQGRIGKRACCPSGNLRDRAQERGAIFGLRRRVEAADLSAGQFVPVRRAKTKGLSGSIYY